MKKLGFGMMRLPMPDPKNQGTVDVEQVRRMVDTFLDRGFIYFDTAYFYHEGQSENVVREALTSRYPRDKFLLADKMPVSILQDKGPEDQDRIFHEQLEKCGVDYFDYYLVHCLNSRYYPSTAPGRLDTFGYLAKQREAGKIRHLGFSFHDKADVLDRILTEHPEVEFVQLQLNYLDWEDERVQSRKCYEVCVKHGKSVIVMEPVKGGRLANLPEDAAALLREAHPDWSPASWAIRFAAGLEHVMMVLSGMSNLEQLLDNTGFMDGFRPLTAGETGLLEKCAEILSAVPAIACTACRYCVDGCPQSIPIPDYFALYNAGQLKLRRGLGVDRAGYEKLASQGGKASDCVACRQCEEKCPQHLPVTDWLERVKKTYEA